MADTNKELIAATEQVAALTTENTRLKADLKAVEKSANALEKELKNATEQVATLTTKTADLEAEIEALKVVNEAQSSTEAAAPEATTDRLSDEEREFTASWSVPNLQKSGKFRLLNVPKIHISGKKYSQKEFMASTDLQSKAASMGHKLITELK